MEAMGMQGVESKVEVAPPSTHKVGKCRVTSPDISRFFSCFERFKLFPTAFHFLMRPISFDNLGIGKKIT